MPTVASAPPVSNPQIEPALLRAWSQVDPTHTPPLAIHLLKRRLKSAIYRLPCAGPGGVDVIAKRCLRATGEIERLVYQEILPALPLSAVRCFGFVDDPDPQFGWLFLEDAGQEPFSPASLDHGAAAAQWLAILHTLGASCAAARQLPNRGPEYYLGQLRLARSHLLGNLNNPALKPDGAAVFEQILTQCDLLESRWDTVAGFCREAPETLVHGDLKENNVRVRHRHGQIELLPFDWEIAGWGPPAVDLLKCPDFTRYWLRARERWPGLDSANLQRLAQVGMVFRSLVAIGWESLDLGAAWVEWPVGKLSYYTVRLIEASRALGLR